MTIAIVGKGNVGSALSKLWAPHHTLLPIGRQYDPAHLLAADVIVLCLPWTATEAFLTAAPDLNNKIIIDCTNPVGIDLPTSAAHRIQSLHPHAHVVKAFNTLGAALLGQPHDGFYCGDHAPSKQTVAPLIAAAGLRPVDVGPLRTARYLEALAMLWIDLAVFQKITPTFAFELTGFSR